MMIETRYVPASGTLQRYFPVESAGLMFAGTEPSLVAHGIVTPGVSTRSMTTVTGQETGSGPSLSSRMPFRFLVTSQIVPVTKRPVAADGRTTFAAPEAAVGRAVGDGAAAWIAPVSSPGMAPNTDAATTNNVNSRARTVEP